MITPAVEQAKTSAKPPLKTSSLSEKCAGKSLMATILSVSVSYTRHTSPTPPRLSNSIRR